MFNKYRKVELREPFTHKEQKDYLSSLLGFRTTLYAQMLSEVIERSNIREVWSESCLRLDSI